MWTFALADALLEKRVFMQAGANTTYVLYRLVRASRSHQSIDKSPRGLWRRTLRRQPPEISRWKLPVVERGLRVAAFDGAMPFYVLSSSGTVRMAGEWYRNFDLAAERARGLRDHTDHFLAGKFTATLSPGESLTIVASTDASPSLDGEAAYAARAGTDRAHCSKISGKRTAERRAPLLRPVEQLVLAADQFIAARPLAEQFPRRKRSWRATRGSAIGDVTR